MPKELTAATRLATALRRIYDRPQPPAPWRDGANLPWHDLAFSERMLAQHLDPSHGAASRPLREMRAQVQRMTAWLLAPGQPDRDSRTWSGTGQIGARVKVTLEIEAQLPEGAPGNVVRTVSENARTLKFKSAGFEDA